MDDKTRKILERPFPPDIIKQRQGPNGKVFAYIAIQHYVDRLNEAFAGDWSLENIRREQIDDQVIVEVKLTAAGVIKTGLGGTAVTRRRDNGKLVSLADDFKKAEADAIKRACRLLGIGSNLYGSDAGLSDENGDEEERVVTPRHKQQQEQDMMRLTPMPQTAPQRGPERTRLTSKQLGAIFALARRLGMDREYLRSFVRDRYAVVPEHLEQGQASALISALQKNVGDSNGHVRDYRGQTTRDPGEDG